MVDGGTMSYQLSKFVYRDAYVRRSLQMGYNVGL